MREWKIELYNLKALCAKEKWRDFEIEFYEPKKISLVLLRIKPWIIVEIRHDLLLSLLVCSSLEDNGGAMILRGLTRDARTVCINSRRYSL